MMAVLGFTTSDRRLAPPFTGRTAARRRHHFACKKFDTKWPQPSVQQHDGESCKLAGEYFNNNNDNNVYNYSNNIKTEMRICILKLYQSLKLASHVAICF
jgi:hypothetical protein